MWVVPLSSLIMPLKSLDFSPMKVRHMLECEESHTVSHLRVSLFIVTTRSPSAIATMALARPYSPTEGLFKLDHFHEYDLNTEELFEVREILSLPKPASREQDTAAPLTRVGKLKNVFNKVTRKKSIKSQSIQSPQKQSTQPISRHATFPRMKTEREKHIQDLHDETFGIGAYAQPQPEEDWDDREPDPWISPYAILHSRSYSENCVPHGTVTGQMEGSCSRSLKKQNPFWEQEFELPEPDLHLKDPSEKPKHSPATGYIPIYISNCYISKNGPSTKESPKGITQQQPETAAKNTCSLSSMGTTPSARILTNSGVREKLGDRIANEIVTELTLRRGPPLPLPPRTSPDKDVTNGMLKLRGKAVIATYALWASIFLFQKLILAIRLGLPRFKPAYRGIVSFAFKVPKSFIILNV